MAANKSANTNKVLDKIKPVALFPTYEQLLDMDLNEYPQLDEFLSSASFYKAHWNWGKEFLCYIGRNKSEHTYGRFRTEVERFLLWAFLVKHQSIDQMRKTDILDYADFCFKPPVSWICLANYEKFRLVSGVFKQNPDWAPFRMQMPKHAPVTQERDKKKYQPSQQTLASMFTGITVFYKYLMNEEYAYGNPAHIARSDCRHFIKDAQVKEVHRLSEAQWQYMFDVALKLANANPRHERDLFIICALKTLFLRISELSERKNWIPMMSHFWQDSHSNWWLKVYGKGRKIRDVSVPPSFMEYLKRYRNYRGLSPLPSSGETHPIVEKIRGQGGLTSRQLMRIVQGVFDAAYEVMLKERGADQAQKLKEASTHWLRHTGASMEIERGRALKDVSEDLGHSSMATTDTIYVQTESRLRAESGKDRKVK